MSPNAPRASRRTNCRQKCHKFCHLLLHSLFALLLIIHVIAILANIIYFGVTLNNPWQRAGWRSKGGCLSISCCWQPRWPEATGRALPVQCFSGFKQSIWQPNVIVILHLQKSWCPRWPRLACTAEAEQVEGSNLGEGIPGQVPIWEVSQGTWPGNPSLDPGSITHKSSQTLAV